MKLSRLTPCQRFDIKKPRYHDNPVLLAKFKVGTHNEIVFTQDPSKPDTYYVSREDVINSPLTTNGKLDCYAVSLNDLEVLERV